QQARFGQADLPIGERIAERVVGMLVIRLQFDDTAQQPLHVAEPVELFLDHGLLVKQVGVVGKGLVGLRQYFLGLASLFGFAQQFGLGDELGVGIGGCALGNAADQLAGLGHLALLDKERGAARLNVEGTLRVVDAREPALGAGQIALLLRCLRQQ